MKNIIPVITLKQPWASWIMWGWKTIESRTHTKFNCLKGEDRLGIHAGKNYDDSDLVVNNPYLTYDQLIESQLVPQGVILGTVNCFASGLLNKSHEQQALIECEKTVRYGLFVKDPIEFANPIPAKGELSIWYYDLDKKCKVKKPQNSPLIKLF